MNDVSKQRLKRTIASALVDVDQMQQELAIIRAQCKLLQEEMRDIRVKSMRNRIHTVPNGSQSESGKIKSVGK